MGYILVLYDEDGNDYRGTTVYDTYDEAEEAIEDALNGSSSYIDDHEIVGGEIEEDF